jgi:hypothetical protein
LAAYILWQSFCYFQVVLILNQCAMKPKRIEKLYKAGLVPVMIIAFGLLTGFSAGGQNNNKDALLKMMEEDRSTIDAIAGYDQKVQGDILQLAETPEVLNIVQDLQKKSEKRFRDLIVPYDRDQQAALYDMARYPDLITELVRNGRPSASEVNRIVLKYPADIRETAKKYARSSYDALRQIDALNNEIDKDFQSYLAPYDEQTRNSVNVLLKYPEIVSILVEDKDFTSLLGATYREDPQWVMDQLDNISAELESQNKKDVADYKKQVESDPEAYNEMLSAADKFAEENNISRADDAYVDPEADVSVMVSSYPYWFGYPYWYPYPYWRPYPAYYLTGFYWGPGRNLIFCGLPSSYFIYWQTHYHPTLYPHLSYCYYNYYHSHYLPYQNQWRRPMSNYGFYRSVERNVINNPRVNNDNLMRIDRSRGNNIVRQPQFSPSSTFGRRGETSGRQYTTGNNAARQGSVAGQSYDRRASVRRDAFPKMTPSDITPGRSNGARQNATRNFGNAGTTRSGQLNTGIERMQRLSPTEGRTQRSPVQNNGGRNMIQPRQGGSSVNTPQLRNYNNYKATEPRQAAPLRRETRSAPANVAPSRGRGQASIQRSAPSRGREQASMSRGSQSRSNAGRSSGGSSGNAKRR